MYVCMYVCIYIYIYIYIHTHASGANIINTSNDKHHTNHTTVRLPRSDEARRMGSRGGNPLPAAGEWEAKVEVLCLTGPQPASRMAE